jgi:hypothetical protein
MDFAGRWIRFCQHSLIAVKRRAAPFSWIHIDDYSLDRSTIAMYMEILPALVAGILFETRVFQFGWFMCRQTIDIVGKILRGEGILVADLDLDIRAAGRGPFPIFQTNDGFVESYSILREEFLESYDILPDLDVYYDANFEVQRITSDGIVMSPESDAWARVMSDLSQHRIYFEHSDLHATNHLVNAFIWDQVKRRLPGSGRVSNAFQAFSEGMVAINSIGVPIFFYGVKLLNSAHSPNHNTVTSGLLHMRNFADPLAFLRKNMLPDHRQRHCLFDLHAAIKPFAETMCKDTADGLDAVVRDFEDKFNCEWPWGRRWSDVLTVFILNVIIHCMQHKQSELALPPYHLFGTNFSVYGFGAAGRLLDAQVRHILAKYGLGDVGEQQDWLASSIQN